MRIVYRTREHLPMYIYKGKKHVLFACSEQALSKAFPVYDPANLHIPRFDQGGPAPTHPSRQKEARFKEDASFFSTLSLKIPVTIYGARMRMLLVRA
jgi:hypothetical protein